MSEIAQTIKAQAIEAHAEFCRKHDAVNITVFEAIYYAGVLDGLAHAKHVLNADRTVDSELARFSA